MEEITIPDFIPEATKNKYKEIATRLIELELLTEIDYPAFNMMMLHYNLALEAMATVKEKGVFQTDRKIKRKNPGVQIFRENSAAFLKYAAKFGLFPKDRETLEIDLINLKSFKKQQLRRAGLEKNR